jgi:signal transduction histidine kinase
LAGTKKHLSYENTEFSVFSLVLLGVLIWLFPMLDAVFLLLFLVVLASLLFRWRFPLAPEWMLIDCGLLCLVCIRLPEAALLLCLYILFFCTKGRWFLSLPFLVYAMALLQMPKILFVVFSFSLGVLLWLWKQERGMLQEETDRLRLQLHHADQEQLRLLSDYQDAQQLSRLEERDHIAQILHDSLGHELTAAHLSLKAQGTFLRKGELDKAMDSQQKIEMRLQSALEQLKLAVRQLDVAEREAQSRFDQLISAFEYPVEVSCKGDLDTVQPALAQVLYAGLKEALTNISKHAKPTKVTVLLDCTPTYVRLMVENDGILEQAPVHTGNGLRYMRRRVEAMGGSVAIQQDKTFRLIITLIRSQKELT